MSNPDVNLARPRWTIAWQSNILELADGTSWELPDDIPEAVLEALRTLPEDYIEMGNAYADEKLGDRATKRELDAARSEVADWKMKYENIRDQDINTLDKMVAVLSDDLEEACNLLIRISVALGIQPSGEFFDTIKRLVEKYGMTMHYAKDYRYEGTITALHSTGPAQIIINDKGQVEVNPLLEMDDIRDLPSGSYRMEGSDDDPFSYHIQSWENEGGDGVHNKEDDQ